MISLVLLTLLGATGAGVSAQPGAPGAERFILSGLVVWSGNEGVAWLQEPELTRNQIVALRIGESVGSWKLTRFLDNGVELDGPAGKVLVPLQNAGAGGTAVAAGPPAGGPAGPAPAAASPAGAVPRDDATRVATPSAPVSPDPGWVWESSRPAPNAGALGEALNKARAGSAGNAQAPAGGQAAVRNPRTPSGATSSDGASSDGGGGTNQVIRLPLGGGKQGIRELFGNR
jgi:hypothetical protein